RRAAQAGCSPPSFGAFSGCPRRTCPRRVRPAASDVDFGLVPVSSVLSPADTHGHPSSEPDRSLVKDTALHVSTVGCLFKSRLVNWRFSRDWLRGSLALVGRNFLGNSWVKSGDSSPCLDKHGFRIPQR